MKEKNADLDIVQEFSYYQDSRSFKITQEYVQFIRIEFTIIRSEEVTFSVLLESVLIGHEDWISQVSWKRPTIAEDGVQIVDAF